jgi:hypothetical protein
MLLKSDISMQPVDKKVYPEVGIEGFLSRPPVALVSYADGDEVFYRNQNALNFSSLNKGFDHIFSYRRSHIDYDFYHKNKHILTQKRGAGYWLWKPYFILKTMQLMPEGSVIIYADSGVVFTGSIKPILDLLQENDMVLSGHGTPAPLRNHLKMEARKILSIEKDEKILNSQNIWAFFIALRNNKSNRELVRKWLSLCENADLLTDSPLDPSIQEKGLAHQHDQSLLSVVIAQHPEKKLILKRYVLRTKYNVDNFHRHQEQGYTSPLMNIYGVNKKLAEILMNNQVFNKLREIIQ